MLAAFFHLFYELKSLHHSLHFLSHDTASGVICRLCAFPLTFLPSVSGPLAAAGLNPADGNLHAKSHKTTKKKKPMQTSSLMNEGPLVVGFSKSTQMHFIFFKDDFSIKSCFCCRRDGD